MDNPPDIIDKIIQNLWTMKTILTTNFEQSYQQCLNGGLTTASTSSATAAFLSILI